MREIVYSNVCLRYRVREIVYSSVSEVQGEGNLLFIWRQYYLVSSGIVSDETAAQEAESNVGEIPALSHACHL